MRVHTKVIGLAIAGVLLTACAGDGESSVGEPTEQTSSAEPTATAEPTPKLGGAFGRRDRAPSKPMNDLEQPIAAQLQEQVKDQGLTLDYLDCPKWNGKAPQTMTCEAYLDGVTADVAVRLSKTTTSVNFDAELENGVLATANLVKQLKDDGYKNIDCGERAAYPTRKGSELICSVSEGGEQQYVVATVLNRSGAISISDY